MYAVDFTKQARQFLEGLPTDDRTAIIRKIHATRNNPTQHLKKLHGPFWRLRILQYRAIVDVIVSGRRMIILKIGHRRNVYDN